MYPPTVADALGQKQAATLLQSNCNHSAILLKYCMVSISAMQHLNRAKRRQKMVQQMRSAADTTLIPDFTPDFRTLSSLRLSMRNRAKPTVGRIDFVCQLTLYFPEVATFIDESDFGILPLEVGAMTVATKDALNRFDLLAVRRYLVFIGDLFERADAELQQAIQIAYLENLFLGEKSYAHVEARYMLPRCLADALKKSESHFERLAAA